MLTHNERLITCRAMKQYGGSFVKAIGAALLLADQRNMARIEGAFPDYIKQYGPGSEMYKAEAMLEA